MLSSTSSAQPLKRRTFSIGDGKAKVNAPAEWSQVSWPGTTMTELVRTEVTPAGAVRDARIMVSIEQRLSHTEALDRLAQIAAERPGAKFLLIGGWPALQRRQVVVVPPPAAAKVGSAHRDRVVLLTTAVAVRDLVFRSEGSIREGNTAAADEVAAIGRSMRFAAQADAAASRADLARLREAAARPDSPPAPAPRRTPRGRGATPVPSAPSAVGNLVGELEVAASTDGSQVVVAAQFTRTFFSTDAGLTFRSSAVMLPPGFGNNGDPSIALGASGRFYLSFLGMPSAGGCTATVAVSPPASGSSFSFVGNAALCPGSGDPKCFPDQEHIAADPNPSTTRTDQLYVVWRHFTPWFNSNCPTSQLHYPFPTISCSLDGGASWRPPVPITAGDDARVTVGGDGSVWVVQRSGAWITISKFNSCENGLVMQPGFPNDIVRVSDPQCPVSGLDRCSGEALSSATVAVDRADPNHVYIAYAEATSNANDDIKVIDTTNGFATFPTPVRSVTVNGPAVGRRFMPWACTLGSSLQVGWYDRTGATATGNDLTAYFRGSAFVDSSGLVSGSEVNVSVNSDPQCATGFPCGHRGPADASSCPTPGLDGACNNNAGNGSLTACEQANPSCPAGEVCVANGGNTGCPKYGDYNGIACGGGYPFTAWASATAPPGLRAPVGIGIFVDARPCGAPGQSCCLSSTPCSAGLTCNGGTCTATTACGAAGQPCCGGSICVAGSVCVAGTCAACPPGPRTLVDTTATNGSDCGGTARDYDFGPASCDAGFQLGACTATLVSQANGSTCSATPLGGCQCRLHVTTPADCSKWATCRLTITEKSNTPPPAGCPGGAMCGGSGQPCCAGGTACSAGFTCSNGVCTAAACGGNGELCCASGPPCDAGLNCTGGTCSLVSCGSLGQLCCSGNTCSSGNTCAPSGRCVACPSAGKQLVDTIAHNGADCGGTSHDYFFGLGACDPGFVLDTCSATLSSQANGSTCSATPAGGCRCKVTVTTPADCFKWADCRVIVSEKPTPGCP
jgi:hypothetical protein